MEKQKDSWFIPIATLIAVGAAIVLAFIGSGELGGTEVDEAAGGPCRLMSLRLPLTAQLSASGASSTSA